MQPEPDRPEPDRRDGDPGFLTLFVDASFCHRTHAAGYGAWAKKATFAKGLISGGRLPRGISNAAEAELGGIALALRYLLEREHLAGLDRLMVQSDSLRSLQLIARALPRVRIAKLAQSNFAAGTNVVSDGLPCWQVVTKASCDHFPMNTGSGKKAAQWPSFNWVNTTLGKIKTAFAGTYHYVSQKHAPRHLASFA